MEKRGLKEEIERRPGLYPGLKCGAVHVRDRKYGDGGQATERPGGFPGKGTSRASAYGTGPDQRGMAECDYINVEVASQGRRLQTKVNGVAGRDLDAMRGAPVPDVMRLRLELTRLAGLCEKVIREAGYAG